MEGFLIVFNVYLLIFCTLVIWLICRDRKSERETWENERNMLLDRIMSVDYTEYKVMNKPGTKQAKKPEEPTPRLV